MSKRKSKGDIAWYLPGRKTPFEYSTRAASDLIVMLSQTQETIQDVYNSIAYDIEAKNILQIYINKGFGQQIARDLFK